MNLEVRVENEVRTRITTYLASAGMGSAGVAKEVLYWLPSEFIDYYRDLFLKAFKLNGIGANSLGAANGDEDSTRAMSSGDRAAERLGKAKVDMRLKGTEKGNGLAGGGGKRYRNTWIIKDEKAMQRLGEVDKMLRALVGRTGLTEKPMGNAGMMKVCNGCGKIMKKEWMRCPFHL